MQGVGRAELPDQVISRITQTEGVGGYGQALHVRERNRVVTSNTLGRGVALAGPDTSYG